MAKKERIINHSFKTLFFDYDGTLFDTSEADKYSLRNRGLRRFTPEWHQARKEYVAHIKTSLPFEGWQEVFQFIIDNNIQAAIVSGNSRQVLNMSVKACNLYDVFPQDKINRIGGTDVKGKKMWKAEGDPALFLHALKQLNVAPEDVIAFGNHTRDALSADRAGIKAVHCLWGVKEEEQRQLMLADPDHECITSPQQIIDILRSTQTPQGQESK